MVVPWKIVLEYRSIRLVPWNFGTGTPSETIITTVEKTTFRSLRKTRKELADRVLLYGTLLFAANLKVHVYGNFRASTRRVSMTYPDIGFPKTRVKSESERIRLLTRGGQVACLGTRYVRVCPYSRRIRVRIV